MVPALPHGGINPTRRDGGWRGQQALWTQGRMRSAGSGCLSLCHLLLQQPPPMVYAAIPCSVFLCSIISVSHAKLRCLKRDNVLGLL